ncbi:MAG: vgr related protein [Sphingomonadales bacterium]|nr:MAG: vgr related protein [Sphingomonadales bacterium]
MAATTRRLTEGEVALARSLFQDAIDYDAVRLHRRRWAFWHRARYVMAPDGHLWFAPGNRWWREDFASADLAAQGLFCHEMTHVWQHQSGRNLVAERPPWAAYRYLPLKPGRRFEAYGLEQQAEIVRHTFLLRRGAAVSGAPDLAAYERLLPFGVASV